MPLPNWVDVLIVFFLARQIYLVREGGLIAEFFKLVGVACAIFVAVHYYSIAGKFLKDNLLLFDKINELIAFSVISILIIALFSLIYSGRIIILKISFHPLIDRWMGIFLGSIKAILFAGLLFFTLLVSGTPDIVRTATSSYVSVLFQDLPINVYESFYYSFVMPFSSKEKINKNALKLRRPPKEIILN